MAASNLEDLLLKIYWTISLLIITALLKYYEKQETLS